MVQRKISPLLHLALLAALATVTLPVAAIWAPPANAQLSDAAAFPMPTTVPSGTTVRIDGANSMVAINQALKQKFEGKFVGTNVNIATNGIESALQALLDGQLDLLAIGRPLTPEEKSKGLKATPAVRDKIAILVGPNNPFKGSLTIHQFAKIFRGEITDWSEVGGPPGPIRLIDRPETSDTRQAFQNYPVFQSAPFQAVATATQIPDNTAKVIEQLGTDGISYATANQVKDVTAVRILNMHKVLPDDPRYPFSQPLLYVYKGEKPSPAVQAFIGYATAPEGRAAIAQARLVEAAAIAAAVPAATSAATSAATPAAGAAPSPGTADSPSGASPSAGVTPAPGTAPGATPSPEAVSLLSPAAAPATLPTNDYNGAVGWLWGLLPLGLLGAWLLLRRKGAGPALPAAEVLPPTPPAVLPVDASLPGPVTTPEPAAPPVPDASAAGWAVGGAALAAGAGAAALGAGATSDVEPSSEPAIAPPQPPTPVPDPWDETPVVPPLGVAAAAGVAAAGAAAAIVPPEPEAPPVEAPIETPDLSTPEVVEPEVVEPTAEIPAVAEPAVDAPTVETPEVPAPQTPAPEGDFDLSGVAAALGGAAALGLGAAAVTAFKQESQTDVEATRFATVPSPSDQPPSNADLIDANLASVDANLPDLPDGYGDSRIVLIPRDPQWGYAYWDTPNEHKEELRRQGGQTIALRIYDVTDGDIPGQAPQNLQQYDCGELARDWHVPIPFSDRDYVAEIGYLTADGRWLSLAKSLPIRIPPMFPSDWADDQFLTLGWQEDVRGRTFMQLMPGRSGGFNNPIYDHIFGLTQSAEAQRVAGSLFGSMQHVAGSVPGSAQMVGSSERMIGASEQMIGGSERMIGSSERMFGSSERMMGGSESLSSFSLAARMPGFSIPTMSGIGMNMSGVGMSGVGMNMSGVGFGVPTMSGIGMSGIGFFSSMPPVRARKFWLIAEAELIVYGATEPDATVYIGGQPIVLNPDGTFRYHMPFPEGQIDFPILAIAADGVQTRAIHMNFNRATPERRTNTKDEAIEESY